MRILSFDTSSSTLHLALLEGRTPVFERELAPSGPDRQEVASLLMVEIDAAIKALGFDKRSLDLIVVGIGPGSFTGVRVAVITARTLAQVLKLPLIGVSLLESNYLGAVAAISSPESSAAVILATTANQFFYGAFQSTADDPCRQLVPSGFGAAEAVRSALAPVKVWYADAQATAAFPEDPVQSLPIIKNIAVIQAQLAYDRLSLKRLVPGDGQDGKQQLAESYPWTDVLPLYLRSPSVTVKKDYATPNPPHERS